MIIYYGEKIRKNLVKAISDFTGAKSKYLRAPSYAYEIGNYMVDRDGNLIFDDDLKKDEFYPLLGHLKKLGFKEKEETKGLNLCISYPIEKLGDRGFDNLKRLIESKGNLIKKAFDVSSLEIIKDDEKISFNWFSLDDKKLDETDSYSIFIDKLVDMAINQKRVTAKERNVENEKYSFRCFLLRLGFIGDKYKVARKILLKNFTGSSAYKVIKK